MDRRRRRPRRHRWRGLVRTRLETTRSALRDVTGTASMGAECTPMGRHGREPQPFTLFAHSPQKRPKRTLSAPNSQCFSKRTTVDVMAKLRENAVQHATTSTGRTHNATMNPPIPQRCTVGGVAGTVTSASASSSLGRFLGVRGAAGRGARTGLCCAAIAAAAAAGGRLATADEGGTSTSPRPSWSTS